MTIAVSATVIARAVMLGIAADQFYDASTDTCASDKRAFGACT